MRKLFFILAAVLMAASVMAEELKQTFTWNGLTMRYPSDYMITSKEAADNEYAFNCEYKDPEVVAFVAVTYYIDKMFTGMTRDEAIDLGRGSLEGAINNFLNKGDEIIWEGAITSEDSKPYPYVEQPFTVKMSGEWMDIKIAMSIQDDMLVITAMLSEDPSKNPTLQSIVNTIRRQK